MILSKNKSNMFYFMLIAYAFFAFISPLSPIFFVILCALMVFSLFLLDDGDVLCFWAFASCFMGCYNIQTMYLKMLDLVMGLLIIKQLVVAIRQKNKKDAIFIYVVLGLCLISFIYGLIVTHFRVYKLWQSLGIILAIASIYLLGKTCINKLTLTLSIGLITSTLLALLAHWCGISTTVPYILDSTTGFRFSAYFDYVNAFALYCSLCQTCLLTLFLTNKLSFKKWFWLPLLITFIGLFTFSKSFISITFITYLIVVLCGFIKSKNKKQYAKYCFVGLIVATLLILICHTYLETMFTRFLVDANYSGALNIATTGRFDIWKTYFKYLINNPLYLIFGRGITADSVGAFTPHNLFISILYRFGIVGTGVLIGLIVFIFKQSKLSKNAFSYLPLLIVLINTLFEDISSSLFTCLPIIIVVYFILQNKQIDTKK